MVRLIRKKLKGSTLIEVLIAMVIITVVFTIAMQVFFNVMNSGVSLRKIAVQNQMRAFSQEIKEKGFVLGETRMVDSVRYELKTLAMPSPSLMQLAIVATQQGKNIGEFRCFYIDRLHHEKN